MTDSVECSSEKSRLEVGKLVYGNISAWNYIQDVCQWDCNGIAWWCIRKYILKESYGRISVGSGLRIGPNPGFMQGYVSSQGGIQMRILLDFL